MSTPANYSLRLVSNMIISKGDRIKFEKTGRSSGKPVGYVWINGDIMRDSYGKLKVYPKPEAVVAAKAAGTVLEVVPPKPTQEDEDFGNYYDNFVDGRGF